MAVKCLTVVLDDEGRELCTLSLGINGQLQGHGRKLKELLRGYAIVHDLRINDRTTTATSMGHLAVLLIRKLRPIAALLEMQPASTRNTGEEYIYTIYPRHTSARLPSLLNLRIEVATSLSSPEAVKTVIYDGLLDEFDPHAVEAEWSHPAHEPKKDQRMRARAAKAARAR
jgi:hypothetical protein